jgi:hypothetical protein
LRVPSRSRQPTQRSRPCRHPQAPAQERTPPRRPMSSTQFSAVPTRPSPSAPAPPADCNKGGGSLAASKNDPRLADDLTPKAPRIRSESGVTGGVTACAFYCKILILFMNGGGGAGNRILECDYFQLGDVACFSDSRLRFHSSFGLRSCLRQSPPVPRNRPQFWRDFGDGRRAARAPALLVRVAPRAQGRFSVRGRRAPHWDTRRQRRAACRALRRTA